MKKLVQREAFNDYVRVKSAELKDKFLSQGFTVFCGSLVKGETTSTAARKSY